MFACLISMLDCEKGIIWNRDIVGLGWGDGGGSIGKGIFDSRGLQRRRGGLTYSRG